MVSEPCLPSVEEKNTRGCRHTFFCTIQLEKNEPNVAVYFPDCSFFPRKGLRRHQLRARQSCGCGIPAQGGQVSATERPSPFIEAILPAGKWTSRSPGVKADSAIFRVRHINVSLSDMSHRSLRDFRWVELADFYGALKSCHAGNILTHDAIDYCFLVGWSRVVWLL